MKIALEYRMCFATGANQGEQGPTGDSGNGAAGNVIWYWITNWRIWIYLVLISKQTPSDEQYLI